MKRNERSEKIKEEILEVVNDAKQPISKREIARLVGHSISTVAKYVDLMQAMKEVDVLDYGNIHLVKKRGG